MKKKFITLFIVLIVFMSIIPVNVKAEKVFDKAVDMEELEVYSEKLSKENLDGDSFIYYKINIPQRGHIVFRYDECPQYTYGYLYDSNASLIAKYDFNATFSLNSEDPILEEGVYYLKMIGQRDDSYFKNLYYKFTPSKEPVLQFKVTLKRGTMLDLAAEVTPKDEKVTWLSTKKSIATVSATGKIKAIKAGTTKVYAILENKTRITLIVVVKN